MRPRHPNLPKRWLMTDERIVDLDAAVARLRRGDGIVFRHYATPLAERRRLFARLLRAAKRRGLALVRAGDVAMRGEMGVHGAGRMTRPGMRTWPAHSRIEAVAGKRAGADVLFVSPVFATRSHIGARGDRADARGEYGPRPWRTDDRVRRNGHAAVRDD